MSAPTPEECVCRTVAKVPEVLATVADVEAGGVAVAVLGLARRQVEVEVDPDPDALLVLPGAADARGPARRDPGGRPTRPD